MGEQKTKSKFNKRRCAKCVYHAGCRVEHSTGDKIICNYVTINDTSCLKRGKNGQVYDIRGEDYNNCLCFKEGEPIQKRRSIF